MQYFYSQKEFFNLISPSFFSTRLRHLLLVLLFCFVGKAYSFQTAPLAQEAEISTGPTHDKYVVGYFAQWAIYPRDFNVSDIEAEHLTHLMYGNL